MPRVPSAHHTAAVAVAVVAMCAASLALATDRIGLFGSAVLGVAALLVGLVNWRWSVYGLLLFIPVSGVPIILTYPNTQLTVLLKDILFVIPAYVGFIMGRRRQRWSFPGAPLLAIFGFSALVIVQCIPGLSSPLVPLVGTKVWLLYIPMLYLGYHLVDSRAQLARVLGVISWSGLLPLAIGIVEVILIYSDRSDLVYGWYGGAAHAVTQDFADVGYTFGNETHVVRVPSTFSFIPQYFDFASAMVAVTFAWWRLSKSRWGPVLVAAALLASLTSGARAAFIMTPLLIGLTVVLARSYRQGGAAALLLGIGLAATAIGLLGVSIDAAVLNSAKVGFAEFEQGFVTGLPLALRLTPLGFGTGQDTNAARYVTALPTSFDPSFTESWWVKAILELGVGGLVMLALLTGALSIRCIRAHRRMKDPGMRAVSGGLLALLLWTLLYGTKGYSIDIDPMNIYFWFFAGMLLRLPELRPSDGALIAAGSPRLAATEVDVRRTDGGAIAPGDSRAQPRRGGPLVQRRGREIPNNDRHRGC